MKYALTILAALIATPAAAEEPPCAPAQNIILNLAASHGEFPVFDAVSTRGYRLVITLNTDTGGYTVLGVLANVIGCILDVGEGGHVDVPEPHGEPS